MVGRSISLFPGEFSTLLLAYEKTDFVKFIHGVQMVGSTVFVPSNNAFAKLGPKTNAFLFNTKTGLKYLKAILKYHIAANATLYTDAFYDETKADGGDANALGREHFDLTTLLHDLPVSVDVARWGALTFTRVNGFSNVRIRDGIAKNGVIHVIDQVLLPQRPSKGGETDSQGDLSSEVEVEDLVERLADYV